MRANQKSLILSRYSIAWRLWESFFFFLLQGKKTKNRGHKQPKEGYLRGNNGQEEQQNKERRKNQKKKKWIA